MQVNAKRRAGKLGGEGIRELHAPSNIRGLAEAAAGHKTTKTPERMSQRQRRGANIERGKQRHFLKMGVKNYGKDCASHAAVKCAAGLKHGHTENLTRFCRVIVPSRKNQPDFGDDERGENHVNSNAPEFVGIDADPCSPLTAIPEAEKHTCCHQYAITENWHSANLKKDGMHFYTRARVACLLSRKSSSTTSPAPITIAESAILNVYQ